MFDGEALVGPRVKGSVEWEAAQKAKLSGGT
jgi:hypothetical protein